MKYSKKHLFLFNLMFLCNITFCSPDVDLLKAAQESNLSQAESAIKHGANVNAKNSDGATPLHLTLNNTTPYSPLVKFLLSEGANVNAKDNYGSTPLHDINTPEISKLLIDNGANVNAKAKAKEGGITLCIFGKPQTKYYMSPQIESGFI